MFDDLKKVFQMFKQQGVKDPLEETLRLFDNLYSNSVREMSLRNLEGTGKTLEEIVTERKKGIPIEYILSRAHFMDRTFIVTNDTLIPTPDTRGLVEAACKIIKERQSKDQAQTIIDMGTGCGNLAISIALETKDTMIYASDLSPGAVKVAQRNVALYKVDDRVRIFSGDLFEPFKGIGFEGNIDMIVCNPPYMPTESVNRLPSEILDHEPRMAFDAGSFGIDFYVRLFEGSLKYLKEGGILIFEIGEGQERIVERLIRKNGSLIVKDKIKFSDTIRGFYLEKKTNERL